MAKVKEFGRDETSHVIDYEDEKTLVAIDKGIRDAEAGRTIRMDEVRKLLNK